MIPDLHDHSAETTAMRVVMWGIAPVVVVGGYTVLLLFVFLPFPPMPLMGLSIMLVGFVSFVAVGLLFISISLGFGEVGCMECWRMKHGMQEANHGTT